MTTETEQLRICWGSFDPRGCWIANPHLDLSTEQQRAQNIAAGFMDEQGKRIKQADRETA